MIFFYQKFSLKNNFDCLNMFQVVLNLNKSFFGCHELKRVTCPVNKTVEFEMKTENSFDVILNLVRKIIVVALDFSKKFSQNNFFQKMKPRERNQK